MYIEKDKMLAELLAVTNQCQSTAQEFTQLPLKKLNYKTSPDSWSILECLEHLNRYGDFYLEEIEKRMLSASKDESEKVFKSGIIGNYFVKLIKVEKTQLKKMKAPKEMNPIHATLNVMTIQKFIKQQQKLLNLLRQAQMVDLNKTKTSITLTKWIKLKLGDTLRFVVFHNQRHILQAQRVFSVD